jgi:DNA-binding NarL/FixJ family response regulator
MISTVVVSPQKQTRDKIIFLLSGHDDIKVLAHGKDGYDALKLIGGLKPDIAILDTHLEFIEGEEIPPLLKTRSPETAVVILITRISDYQLYRAAVNAVLGFVKKETDLDTLPEILKCIACGGCFISPGLGAKVLHLLAENGMSETQIKRTDNMRLYSDVDPTGYLSKTELRILTSIGEGYNSKEIAKSLDLAVGTVRNYISSVMRKTGLHNRSQMARFAFHYGLVSLDSE